MNIKEALVNIDSGNSTIIAAKELTEKYGNMLHEGKISSAEFTELMLDVQRSINIQQHMIALDELEKMNIAINGIITLATIL